MNTEDELKKKIQQLETEMIAEEQRNVEGDISVQQNQQINYNAKGVEQSGKQNVIKKLFSVWIKMGSIICWLITFALGALLFYSHQNQDGLYVETSFWSIILAWVYSFAPYIIGMVVVMACLSVILWNWSNYLTLVGTLYRSAIMSLVVAGYFAFTPVVTVSTLFGMLGHSGNIFTFKTDDSFSVLQNSDSYYSFEASYHRHIAYVVALVLLSIILVVVGKKVNLKIANKKGF